MEWLSMGNAIIDVEKQNRFCRHFNEMGIPKDIRQLL